MSKKDKSKGKTDEIREKESIEQEFDPEVHGIAHLDELAMRLSVPEAQEGDPGIVMFGRSGRAYPLTTVLANVIQFQVEAVMHVANMVARMEGTGDGDDKGTGQPEKSSDPGGDSESDQS